MVKFQGMFGLKQPHFSLDDRRQVFPSHRLEGGKQLEIKFQFGRRPDGGGFHHFGGYVIERERFGRGELSAGHEGEHSPDTFQATTTVQITLRDGACIPAHPECIQYARLGREEANLSQPTELLHVASDDLKKIGTEITVQPGV